MDDTWLQYREFCSADDVAALIDTGDEDGVAELLQVIHDRARLYSAAGLKFVIFAGYVDYLDGLAHFLGGNHERGLELIIYLVFVNHAKACSEGLQSS